MSGTHVAGFVSCRRIFQLRNSSPVTSLAPLRPSSCLMPPLPSSASLFVSAAFGSVCMEMSAGRTALLEAAAARGSGAGRTEAKASHVAHSEQSRSVARMPTVVSWVVGGERQWPRRRLSKWIS